MHQNKKSDLEKFSEKWLEVHELDWLFPSMEEPYQSPEYLQWFHHHYGPMFMNRCPSNYKWKLLERHKENIVFSNHLMGENIVIPYTMMQYGPQFHVAADWLWNEDIADFLLSLNIFYKDHKEYAKFLRDNADLQHFDREIGMGFETGGFGGGNRHDSSVNVSQ